MKKQQLDKVAHILYSELPDVELKNLIKETAEARKMNSAGRDLQEMRREYRRRNFRKAGQKRIRPKRYDKPDTPEDFAKRVESVKQKQLIEKGKDRMMEDTNSLEFSSNARVVGGLTPKQDKFCTEYIATKDLVHSYTAAGYATGGSKKETLKRAKNLYYMNPKVRKRVEHLKEESLRRMSWSSEKVLEKVSSVYENAMGENDFTNANRSMETIARHLGMFIEKSEQKIKMSGFSDEDEEEKLNKDINKLADMIGLKVVEGGKK
jgi:phage terminase small subunit